MAKTGQPVRSNSQKTRYSQSVKSELLETVGSYIDQSHSLFPETCHSLFMIQHTAPSGRIHTSPAHRFRLFLCAKRRPSSWNLFSASSQTLSQARRRCALAKPPHDQTIKTKRPFIISQPVKSLSASLLRSSSFYMIYPPRPVHVVQYRQYLTTPPLGCLQHTG